MTENIDIDIINNIINDNINDNNDIMNTIDSTEELINISSRLDINFIDNTVDNTVDNTIDDNEVNTIDNTVEKNEVITIDNQLKNVINDFIEDEYSNISNLSIITNLSNMSKLSNLSNLSNKSIINNSDKYSDKYSDSNSDILEIFIKKENKENKDEITNNLTDTILQWDSLKPIINTKVIKTHDIPIKMPNINSNIINSMSDMPNMTNMPSMPDTPINFDIENTNITFTSANLNEIKSLATLNNTNTNSDNLSSINSSSEVNYTNIAQKQHQLDTTKVLKHIRGAKKKHKHKDDNELDDVDYLYNKIQDYMRYMQINRNNYILLIVKAMEIIENSHNANEIDKKNTVIKAINRIVLIDLNLSDFDQTLFLSSLNNIIEIIVICSKTNKYNSNTNDKFNNDDLILASSGQIVHSLIDRITTIIIKKQYNADKLFVNISTITNILMILVNKYNYINSIEKKFIVIQAFTIFINDKLEYIIDLNKEKKRNLILSLDSLPFIIDLLSSLQNGKYRINRKLINMVNTTSFKKKFCWFSKKNNDD